jgi:RNA polymerase sigma-70 factor (ECF subfamily)
LAYVTFAPASAQDFEKTTLPHLNAVARFALSLTRDRANADDLVQETYLRAYRGWKTFRPDSDARRWLFAICRNTFLRALRQRNRMVECEEGDPDALPAVMSHVQAVQSGLGDLFERIDVRPAIERAVNSLPEPHHSVLVLVDLEDHSYEETAAILKLPIGTVRSRLFRARRLIQEALLAHAEDAGLTHNRPQSNRAETVPS